MSENEKKITEMQEKFLNALFGEAQGDMKLAKDMAGYSKHTRLHDVTSGLEAEIMERARSALSKSTAKAVFTMLSVLDNDFDIGNKDKMAAAKDILDRAGLVKREIVEVKTAEPIFILPAKKED